MDRDLLHQARPVKPLAVDRPLRVLMLSDVYLPRVNGVSTSIHTFRGALASQGIELTLVVPAYPGAGGADGEEGEGIIRVPSRAVPRDPEDRLMSSSALHRLERRLADEDFDLVHAQTPFAAHYAALRLARQGGLPCLATYHTHFEEYLSHYIQFVPRAWLKAGARRVARQQCNALDAVVVPSVEIAETLRAYGISAPLHVIPTGLPEADFVAGDAARFRVRHGIAPQRRIALFVGRAAREKNIEFLLLVIARARAANPDLLLVVAGDGPALNRLQEQAGELGLNGHVLFVGYLERDPGLRDCYAAAAVFVFASQTETQGLVLLEALASGLPVLAISALGTRAIVDSGRGSVAAARTPDAFARQLLELLASPQRLAQLASAGRSFAREWSADGPAEQMARLYRRLASARLPIGCAPGAAGVGGAVHAPR